MNDKLSEPETQDVVNIKSVNKKWAVSDNIFYGASEVVDGLPPGLYRCGVGQQIGPYLEKIQCDTDDLIEFKDSASEQVLEEIKNFWTLEDNFKKYGFLHKRGVLLAGPPGSGKTATIQQLIKLVNEKYEGIAIYGQNPKYAAQCLQLVRRIEPKRPIIMMFEDFDSLINIHGEQEYLSLFDGESQVNNIVFIATSNYPEQLDKRFTDRPSRFDLIKQIDMPSFNVRKEYIKVKVPDLTDSELEVWAEASDGYSFAHIREMIILIKCYEKTLEEAKDRLDSMRTKKLNSAQFDDGIKSTFGFQ